MNGCSEEQHTRNRAMSNELLSNQSERNQPQQTASMAQPSSHPWAQPFGKPGEGITRYGNGWSLRVIHFPTGPSVVQAEGPLERQWPDEQEQLLRLGFRPEQATALLVLKSYHYAEGDCAEREREQRRLAYARYLVDTGRLHDGVPLKPLATRDEQPIASW